MLKVWSDIQQEQSNDIKIINEQEADISYTENVAIKVITDAKIADQNKYKEWIKGQFSVWDVSKIDFVNLVEKI